MPGSMSVMRTSVNANALARSYPMELPPQPTSTTSERDGDDATMGATYGRRTSTASSNAQCHSRVRADGSSA